MGLTKNTTKQEMIDLIGLHAPTIEGLTRAEVINLIEENAYKGFSEDEIIGMIGENTSLISLIWENVSPSSTFPGQTISLDLSQYTDLLIIAKNGLNLMDISIGVSQIMAMVIEGGKTYEANAYFRKVQINSDGVFINDCYVKALNTYNESSVTINNNASIPLKIYGLNKRG